MVEVTTDIQKSPQRRLQKKFPDAAVNINGNNPIAIGDAAPNTLNGGKPRVNDAMGISSDSGMLSFTHDGQQQDFTVYEWHSPSNALDATKGWKLAAESSALNTKTCQADSIISFKLASRVPYFIKGTLGAINAWMHDKEPHPSNINTDVTLNA